MLWVFRQHSKMEQKQNSTTQTTVTQKCQRPENPQHNNSKLLCCGFSGGWHFWATVRSACDSRNSTDTVYLVQNIEGGGGRVRLGAEFERFLERSVVHLRPVATVEWRLQQFTRHSSPPQVTAKLANFPENERLNNKKIKVSHTRLPSVGFWS